MSQKDLFEHPVNARLVELKKQIEMREHEIQKLREEVREISGHLRTKPISSDGSVRLAAGPGGRAYIMGTDRSSTRIFLPISLDLLAQAVEELKGWSRSDLFNSNGF